MIVLASSAIYGQLNLVLNVGIIALLATIGFMLRKLVKTEARIEIRHKAAEEAGEERREAHEQAIIEEIADTSRRTRHAIRNLTAALALLIPAVVKGINKSDVDALLTDGLEDEDPEQSSDAN